jgi:hypothetical protein
MKINTYYLLPLQDSDNVGKGRADVGLQPLGDYLATWNIKWDAEHYQKDLSSLKLN